ncbi:unnamed protein product [Prunus armeniaca]
MGAYLGYNQIFMHPKDQAYTSFITDRGLYCFKVMPFGLKSRMKERRATTSFLAATTGKLQNDLKRVIAYSTCSQLGYMIFACSISSRFTGEEKRHGKNSENSRNSKILTGLRGHLVNLIRIPRSAQSGYPKDSWGNCQAC